MISVVLAVLVRPVAGVEPATENKLFIENDKVVLGVDKAAGGSVFFFSQKDPRRNLINHYDKGRFIQQSFYGKPDGSMWDKQKWRWNPVQGGGYKGEPAKIITFTNSPSSLYVKSVGKHWATGEDLPAALMEEWITLTGEVSHIRFRFTYCGDVPQGEADQEMPAVFADYNLPALVFYNGQKPWTGDELKKVVPGWPNEGHRMDEEWAAYVDDKDWGMGIYTPGTSRMTSYRYKGDGKSGPAGSACSYLAPLRKVALNKGSVVEYDVYLTIGTLPDIRARFNSIRQSKITGVRPQND